MQHKNAFGIFGPVVELPPLAAYGDKSKKGHASVREPWAKTLSAVDSVFVAVCRGPCRPVFEHFAITGVCGRLAVFFGTRIQEVCILSKDGQCFEHDERDTILTQKF